MLKYLVLASVITVSATYLLHFRERPTRATRPPNLPPYVPDPIIETHPIDHLIRQAQQQQQQILKRQSHDLSDAAAKYRARRGRHPPPGFDAWFEQAQKRDAIVVEDFFDRIHHDLNPFWALDPKQIRSQANSYIQVVRVRNGKATYETDDLKRVPWIQLWHSIVKDAAPYLPDVDMPINYMDETRLLVPWEKINEYVAIEQAKRKLLPVDEAKSEYTGLKDLDESKGDPYDPNWIKNDSNKYWDHARLSCPPDSPSRNVTALESFAEPVDFQTRWPAYSYQGYIQNFTQSQDPCLQPHLRGMHGTFIESVSMSTSHQLIPMFGGSKLPMNNEILIPGAMYITDDPFYSGGSSHGTDWSAKKDELIWRGVASGGRHKADSWHRFHRHRFVQMMNGTTVERVETTKIPAQTFQIPLIGFYDIKAQREGRLGEWVSSFADAGFVNLECFPAEWREGDPHDDKHKLKSCSHVDAEFSVAQSVPMKQQYNYKYLPDVDGNSFSARWRGFLLSTSVPLKSTIYAEWHDDRFLPWAHFVPFDSTYQDVYGIMEYFLSGRDHAAQRIAEEGRDWAEKVFRKEDMALYVWRLLLEFARICDENRDHLGFVGDLVAGKQT